MSQVQDLGFISQFQGYDGGLGLRVYDLGLGVMGQFYEVWVRVMSLGYGLCVRFMVYEVCLVLRVYELGLGVMGQFYELWLGFMCQVQGL